MINVVKNSINGSKWSDDLEINCILQGFGFAFTLLIALAFILAIIVYFSSWSVSSRVLGILTYLSMFFGAFWAGCRSDRRAFLHGIIVGVIGYVALGLMIDQKLFVNFVWWKGLLKMGLVSMPGGIIGGLTRE